STRKWAHEDKLERLSPQALAQALCVCLAPRGEGNVGPARVLTRDGPCRLTMARQVDLGEGFAHDPVLIILHFQSRISGMSSPTVLMYCRCSISLSRTACLA